MVQRPNFFRGDAILKFWQRIIAAVACAAMLIGLGLDAKSPISVQAEALGPAALPVAALAAFVTAAGINWSTSASADQVPGLISRLWGEYNEATGAGDLETIATGHLSVNSLGRIIVGSTLVAVWQKFVSWLQSDKSVAPNSTVSIYESFAKIGDYTLGTVFPLGDTILSHTTGTYMHVFNKPCNVWLDGVHYTVSQGICFYPYGKYVKENNLSSDWGNSYLLNYALVWNPTQSGMLTFKNVDIRDGSGYIVSALGLDPADYGILPGDISDSAGLALNGATAIDVPGQGLADTDSVALDVGATAGATADDIAAAVAAGIAAGTFTASATVEAVEPVPGGNADIDGLGLPSLGALLTTRFPFSIPWDVHAVFTLLSAEAKAPYWEIDLMAPLKSKGQKFSGDTKIKIDLTGDRWAVIGQVSRWGSLVGFCIALAYATKRLIWTA